MDVSSITTATENPLDAQASGSTGNRIIAFIVDTFGLGIVYTVFCGACIGLAVKSSLLSGDAIFNIILALYCLSFLLCILYHCLFLSWKGATPGKMIVKLKVIDVKTGSDIKFLRAFCREFLAKTICWLTFGLGFIGLIFRADKRGLHDILCRTRVVQSTL